MSTVQLSTQIDDHHRGSGTPMGARGELRGAWALARAEALILLRNPTALFTAAAMPLLLVGLLAVLPRRGDVSGALLGMVLGTSLIFVIYYTLVTAVVARREEHTLKRLYASALRPVVVLAAMAAPLFVLLIVQLLVGIGGATLLFGSVRLTHAPLLVVAVIFGAAAWWALALASAGFTRSVESAQLTTMPLILVALGLSGLSVPLTFLPDSLQLVAQLSPLFPVVDLAALASGGARVTGEVVTGSALWSAAGVNALVLVGWLAAGLLVVRRRFRWEPRR